MDQIALSDTDCDLDPGDYKDYPTREAGIHLRLMLGYGASTYELTGFEPLRICTVSQSCIYDNSNCAYVTLLK